MGLDFNEPRHTVRTYYLLSFYELVSPSRRTPRGVARLEELLPRDDGTLDGKELLTVFPIFRSGGISRETGGGKWNGSREILTRLKRGGKASLMAGR